MRDMNLAIPSTRSRPSISPVGSPSDFMRISVCCSQGGRKYMEDRVSIHCEFTEDGQVDYIFAGVFDGHGGADASNFAKQNLLENIIQQPGFNSMEDSEVLEAIRAGFIETHEAMRKVVDGWPRTASGYTSTSGTTASVAFIRRGKMFIGHVGDSGIVIGSHKPTGEMIASSLTVEHKPDTPEEKKRMEDIGGEVMNKSGVMRVVWVRPLRGHQGPVRRSTPKEKIPFLAVARALGDLWSYNADSEAFVVSPEPDVSVTLLDSTHCCLVFGSDGLWNVLRPQHAVDIVNSHEWKEDELSWMGNQNEGFETNHARWLVRHALMRWGSLRADNISVISIIFGNRGVNGSSYAKRIEPGSSSIEDILISEPTSIIKVAPDRVITLPTKPVELVFYGVSEVVSIDRQSILNGKTGSNDVEASASPTNHYGIPGYTTYERGPPFGSLLSYSATSSASFANRYSLHGQASYRQYPVGLFNSLGSSQNGSNTRKENDSSNSTPTPGLILPEEMNTDGDSLTENVEVETSELEDESQRSNGRDDDESEILDDVNMEDEQENQGAPVIKPCNLHGAASCFSCSLIRAALTPQRPGPTGTPPDPVPTPETPKTPVQSPMMVDMMTRSLRRPSDDSSTSPLNTFSLYKCKRMSKRRSCPTGHLYNTRQSCRTTRAGTKLSPQKYLKNKYTTSSPSTERTPKQF